MKTYLLTAKSFTGQVEIEFNDSGLLIKTDLSKATLSEKQHRYLLERMPICEDDVKRVFSTSKNLKFTLLSETEITFDDFWDRYDEKILSSKKRTEIKWNRMTKADRQRAYRFIGTYEASLTAGIRKKYAETYLNAELWNNNK